MIQKIAQLSRLLKSKGFKNESILIRMLLKYAGYEEDWKKKIEMIALNNRYPFADWFEGQSRIYFPFKGAEDTPIDKDVESELNESGYEITDYIGGYCQKEGKVLRIGKVLNKLKREDVKKIKDNMGEEHARAVGEDWDRIINTFINSEYRTNKKYKDDLMVVFSQDPHDLAQMSYERNWTSCMELGEGSYYNSVFCEVESGGFIAYLITSGDKEIENPLARIHIRRFTNQNGISFARPEHRVYGNSVPGFEDFVSKWVTKKNAERYRLSGQQVEGVYELRGGNYSDTYENVEVRAPKTIEGLTQWFKEPPEVTTEAWVFTDEFYDDLDSLGYWDYDMELEFVDEDYEGVKEFDTRHEADSFLFRMMHIDYTDSWIDYLISEDERERLEEEGELDEKIDELQSSRFSVTKKVNSYQEKLKDAAADKLIYFNMPNVPVELAQSLLEYTIQKNSVDQQFKILQKHPELLTDELFESYDLNHKAEVVRIIEKADPELGDKFSQKLREEFVSLFDVNSDKFQETLKKADLYHGSPRYSSLEEKASARYSAILDIIKSALKSDMDHDLYQKFDKFVFEDIATVPDLKGARSHRYSYDISDEYDYHKEIIFSTLRLARVENFPKTTEVDFAKKMWQNVDLTRWERDRGLVISVHDWLWFLRELGANAEPFRDILAFIIQNAEESTQKNEGYIKAKSDYRDYGKGDSSSFKKIFDRAEQNRTKEIKTRVGRVKYVLDCIKNDEPFSKKYEW